MRFIPLAWCTACSTSGMRYSMVFSLALGVHGCDWTEPDTCGGPFIRVELPASAACVDLVGDVRADGGRQLLGTNRCSTALELSVDGGAAMTFPAGSAITISLPPTATMWTLSGQLGANPITGMATETPC